MSEVESLKEIQEQKQWGGARPGAGRKAHSKNKETIEREEAARQFKERVAKNVDRLFNAQLDLALGEKYLMVIHTTGTGQNKKRTTEIVTDVETIKEYLDDNLENTDTEYYFMSTKPANNMALDSLLNRSFGKAEEKLDVTSGGEPVKAVDLPDELVAGFSTWLSQSTKE